MNQSTIQMPWTDWHIVRTLGSGRFGTVFEIRRNVNGCEEKSALKVITVTDNQKDDIVEQYQMMMKKKGHPNIVSCEDLEVRRNSDGSGWTIYIRMELLCPLLTHLRTSSYSDADVIKLGKDLCRALIYGKNNTDTVHGDIKPENIMTSEFGDYKLGDFGIARIMNLTTKTAAASAMNFAAPEARQSPSRKADVYSIGLLMYWLLNNRRMPFEPTDRSPSSEESMTALDRRMQGQPFPTPLHGNSELQKIVLKACEHNPRKRYVSAQEMLNELERLQGRDTFRAEPSKAGNPFQRTRAMAGIAVAAVLVVCCIVAAVLSNGNGTTSKTDDQSLSAAESSDEAPETEEQSAGISESDEPAEEDEDQPVTVADSDEEGVDSDKVQESSFLDINRVRSNDELDYASVTTIIFQDSLTQAPADAWDYSEDQDGSVRAWVDEFTLYIAANGAVKAHGYATELFSKYENVTDIIFADAFDTSGITGMYGLFKGCIKLEVLDLSSFDTSNVTKMGGMFSGCSSLKSLDLSSFDTSNVTDMYFMFNDCSELTSLNVSSFDTSNVTNMENMFDGCASLESLNLSNFDTSSAADMSEMFEGCSNLEYLNISGFDTSNVTDMGWMFSECASLKSLDLSSFNTSNVTKMFWMFSECSSLESLDLSSFDTSNVIKMDGMFSGCSSLKSLDLSSFDTSNVEDMSFMFHGCDSLPDSDKI